MKALIKIAITFALICLFISCTEDNLITESETSSSEISTLEKGVTASASGHGDVHYDVGEGPTYQRFSFNATDKDGEVHGVLHYYDDQYDLKFKGEITCLTVDGNVAIMAGKILKYTWDVEKLPPYWDKEIPTELLNFWVKVVDNGEGKNFPPDKTSLVWAPILDYGCIDFADFWSPGEFPMYDIESGNFQVRQ